jgi:hypothetical protein
MVPGQRPGRSGAQVRAGRTRVSIMAMEPQDWFRASCALSEDAKNKPCCEDYFLFGPSSPSL